MGCTAATKFSCVCQESLKGARTLDSVILFRKLLHDIHRSLLSCAWCVYHTVVSDSHWLPHKAEAS